MVALVGDIEIELRVPDATVRNVSASPLWYLALIVVVPTEMAVARPAESMVATPGCEEDHAAPVETSSVAPSARVPVATNCSVPPTCTVGLDGEMVIDTMVLFETKNDPPHPLIKRISIVAQSFSTDSRLSRCTSIICNHTVRQSGGM